MLGVAHDTFNVGQIKKLTFFQYSLYFVMKPKKINKNVNPIHIELGSNYKTTHLLNKYLTNEEYSQVVIMNLGVHILGIS